MARTLQEVKAIIQTAFEGADVSRSSNAVLQLWGPLYGVLQEQGS